MTSIENNEIKNNEELRKRVRDLESIFEHGSTGMSIVDKNGNILRSNPAMQKLLQLNSDELVGKNVHDMESKGVFNKSVSPVVLKTKESFTLLQETSTGIRILSTGVPIFGEDGEVELIVINSHDVTELYSLQERLKKRADGYREELRHMRDTYTQDIVVRSKKMLDILELCKRLSVVDTTVLITGESGTGKEVIANLLHKASPKRFDNSFITINCGAIPRNLLEAELFGYEYGAFTGAAKEGKTGLLELADRGTFFLDEVGELPLELQVKLLRVLQEKQFSKIGSSKVINVDIRFIAATNKDLLELVRQEKFREDLYYRLNIIPLEVPPLSERKEDITALAQHYVRCFNKKYGVEKVLSAELIDAMEKYNWPGNVRELINTIERMAVTSKNNILGIQDFPVYNLKENNLNNYIAKGNVQCASLKEALEDTEKSAIINALRVSKNTTIAAGRLGISRATLVRKMSKYGLTSRQAGSIMSQ